MLTKMMGAAGALSMLVQTLSLGAIGAIGLAAAPAQAASYWGCDSGFAFQTVASGARCFKASRIESAAPLPCVQVPTPAGPIGAALRVDFNGNTDVCATQVGITITASVTCGLGYTMDRRAGADRCLKTIPAEERQPTRKFAV